MSNPMEWAEAINHSVGFYLWTRFWIDVAQGALTVVVLALAFTAVGVCAVKLFKFLEGRDDPRSNR